MKDINANEVTVLGEDEEEKEDFSHVKVGIEVHYTPEDATELKAKIIKVRVQYKLKKIQNKKKVVKPHYELTVRPSKPVPVKKTKSIKGKQPELRVGPK
jgi:hypothetical protein